MFERCPSHVLTKLCSKNLTFWGRRVAGYIGCQESILSRTLAAGCTSCWQRTGSRPGPSYRLHRLFEGDEVCVRLLLPAARGVRRE